DTRLRAALPTIHFLSEKGATAVLLAHFDRPNGKRGPEMSLKPIVAPLSKLIEQTVAYADLCITPDARTVVMGLQDGGVALLENLPSPAGEKRSDGRFAQGPASLGGLYADVSFSASPRAPASTEAVPHFLPAYPGLSMQLELEALDAALGNPQRPVLGIVGG